MEMVALQGVYLNGYSIYSYMTVPLLYGGIYTIEHI